MAAPLPQADVRRHAPLRSPGARVPALLLLTGLLAGLPAGCAEKHESVVHVIAESAPGLKRSARVQYRGIDIGLVKEVYFTNGGVRIDLLILRKDAPIRTQDTVRIVPVGAFGEQVVDIRPGSQSAPLIAMGGGTLPAVQPESTVAVPIEALRSVMRTLNTVIERDSAGTIRIRADSTAGARSDTSDGGDTIGRIVPRAAPKPKAAPSRP